MKLSVVIPAYNSLTELLMCLNSLQATAHHPEEIEWIVQDDCSSAYFLPGLIPPCLASVQRNEQNLGFAGNMNAGIQRATAPIVVACNQDIQAAYGLSDGWDTAIELAFADPQVGIVGARLLFPPPNVSVQSVGGEYDAHLQPFHRYLGAQNIEWEEISTPREVSWVTGAFLAVRRKLFWQVGGFDTAYVGGYFEDTDICMKVRECGYKIWFEPRASFFHTVGTTGGSPHFVQNMLLWKSRWVDTGKVKADTSAVRAGWW